MGRNVMQEGQNYAEIFRFFSTFSTFFPFFFLYLYGYSCRLRGLHEIIGWCNWRFPMLAALQTEQRKVVCVPVWLDGTLR
jgi:hypothetical protein